jgi:hypothetical protein
MLLLRFVIARASLPFLRCAPAHRRIRVTTHPDRLPRRFLRTLLQAPATLSPIATWQFPFGSVYPTLDSAANWHSNPIAHRVRRKRQRLPPSLLIENASDRLFSLSSRSCPEAFPIKVSDNTPRIVAIPPARCSVYSHADVYGAYLWYQTRSI